MSNLVLVGPFLLYFSLLENNVILIFFYGAEGKIGYAMDNVNSQKHPFSILLLLLWHLDKSFRGYPHFGKIILEQQYPGKTVELAHMKLVAFGGSTYLLAYQKFCANK